MHIKTWTILPLFYLIACTPSSEHQELYLGQGIMAGEINDHSAILQTRLTLSDSIVQGDLTGAPGFVRFEWSTDSTFQNQRSCVWMQTAPEQDYIIKYLIEDLPLNTLIYYRVAFGKDTLDLQRSSYGYFRTNPGVGIQAPLSMVVVTGMNYYFHFYGNYDGYSRYMGEDRALGYPALESIINLRPDYFIGTGDNVYFDHPAARNFANAIKNGKEPLPGIFDGKEVTDEQGMRQKYHVQFAQPRFRSLFRQVGTYWEKDDHDYRVNDGDPTIDFPISHELGIKNFREQLPVIDPNDPDAKTYRTVRMNQDLQIWLLEGRDFRSANNAPDGPEKTIWGEEQKAWLYNTLLESDAFYKCIISPTPMVGPDDAYKKDNHVNPDGFRQEGEAFFQWLDKNEFSREHLFIVCGDRHWQYHARHPSGYQEFSTGALVDGNSRAGRIAGDPDSTDPEGKIKQYYIQGTREEATGGFLLLDLFYENEMPRLKFVFHDDLGKVLYSVLK